ncbi:MAG: hypothetical protein ABJ092_10625 [Gillisia sp.]
MTRDLKTILIVVVSGIILVGGLFAYEVFAVSAEKEEVAAEEPSASPETETAIHSDLEKKIDKLNSFAFNPQSYSILMTEIHSYYMTESFTESIKTSLENRLLEVYSKQVFTEAEKFLSGRSQSSQEVQNLLSQLKENGGNQQKINYYQNQINYYNYYSSTLPQKVSNFIRKGITNYTDEEYNMLKDEVNNMSNLENKYKTGKFQQLKKTMIYNLGEFNMAYHIPTYQAVYENI